MSDQETAISTGLLQTPVIGSNNLLPPKKKRNLPGNPDPEADVISLSPGTLMATNRFLCEICGKGFQRDQNLQLHRRGHNLPWKLKQRTSNEPPRKRVYVCPEKSCIHNHPSRALGDLTGIKKHFSRKHGEKKWKCDKCNKKYAVQSDWKAHSKTCGTREYKCDCGTIFSRRDSFITHRAFCDALAEETARLNAANAHFNLNATTFTSTSNFNYQFMGPNLEPSTNMSQHFPSIFKPLSSSTKETLELQTQREVLPPWLVNHLPQDREFQTTPNNNNNNNNNSLWISQPRDQTTPNSNNSISIHDHNYHQLSPTINCLNPQNTSLMIPCSNPHLDNNYNLNWVFGNNNISSMPKNNGEELALGSNTITSTTSTTTSSIPSLYSTQHNQTTTSRFSHIMSATALLQKAAQIGATSTTTTNDPFFLGTFELMKGNVIDGGSLCGTPNSTTTNLGSDADGSSVDDLDFSATINMYNPTTKRRKLLSHDHQDCNGSGGLTLDFLGVGTQPICHAPSTSINGWI